MAETLTAKEKALNHEDGVNLIAALNEIRDNLGTAKDLAALQKLVTADEADIDTLQDLIGLNARASANTLFRGKYLGTSVTGEQLDDISSGTFMKVRLGDYWTIGGHNWRVWGFDWFLHKGNTPLEKHHAVILPDDNLLKSDGSTTHYMNDDNVTTGAYGGSKLRTTYVPQMITTITGLFGSDHVLKHRELIANAVSGDVASNWGWVDSQVEIPSEVMMHGSKVWSSSAYNTGTAYPILPLALVRPEYVVNRENYWLRDVVSASWFAIVDSNGNAAYDAASDAWVGVRPYFLLG